MISSNKQGDIYLQNKSYYDRNAARYEQTSWYYLNKYKHSAVSEEVKRILDTFDRDHPLRVLELGPGTGYLLDKIMAYHAFDLDYTAIEHSVVMSQLLTEKFGRSCNHFRVINATITADELISILKGGKYDLIIGSSILHHLIDFDRVIEILSSAMSDGGILYFVREPIHKDECLPASFISNIADFFYGLINSILMAPRFRKIFWPSKLKAEDVSQIAYHMYKDGVSMSVFHEIVSRGNHRILFVRKYNRRVSSFLSYLENKWLRRVRKDIFNNTLFSICIQKYGRR